MPTGVLPVTLVKEDEQSYSDPIHKSDDLVRNMKNCMEGSKGLPVGVQVSTLPYRDEELMGILSQLEGLLKFEEVPEVVKGDFM